MARRPDDGHNPGHEDQPTLHRSSSHKRQTKPPPSSVQLPSPPAYPRNASVIPPRATDSPSPSSNLGSNSFVFPIRSVFQNMASAESTTPTDEVPGLGPHIFRGGPRRISASEGERRQSVSIDTATPEDVVGISTIGQMLEENESGGRGGPSSRIPPFKEREQHNAPAVATFTGKHDRSKSTSVGSDIKTGDSTLQPQSGLISLGAPPTKSTSIADPLSSFSEQTISSTINQHSEAQVPQVPPKNRPQSSRDGSESTAHPDEAVHEVSSSTAPVPVPASGHREADPKRPPLAVHPLRSPSQANYRDRPGPSLGESDAFKSVAANPPPREKQPHTQLPNLQQPKPRRVGGTSVSSASLSVSTTTRNRGTETAIELDEEGRQSLVGDFSNIVRLNNVSSFRSQSATTGSGVGSRGRPKASGESGTASEDISSAGDGKTTGPTGARLARQGRYSKAKNTRDSVRNFVQDQANTVNLLDPNAPTPSPTPYASHINNEGNDDQVEATAGVDAIAAGLAFSTLEERQAWTDNGETESSVQESGEVAPASVADAGSDHEEPIVTFRFEHVATDDGHHVVVGREGQLQHCEDEPITTPGAVQGFGVLLVLEEDLETGNLIVRQASENSTELIGLSPRYLFRLDCFTRILTTEQEDVLRDNIEYLPEIESEKGSVADEGPQVFLLSGFGEPGSDDNEDDDSASGRRREWTCWVAAHRPKQSTWDRKDENGQPIPPPELIILEFELERDIYNPLMQNFEYVPFSSGRDTPETASSFASGTTASKSSLEPGTASGDSGRVPSDESVTTFTSAAETTRRTRSDQSTIIRPGMEKPPSSDSTLQQPSFSSRLSSNAPPSLEPMGLEGLDVEMPLDRILESTTNHARPLRALERMRRTGRGGDSGAGSGTGSGAGSGARSGTGSRRPRRAPRRPSGSSTGTMDVFTVLGQINEQLSNAPDLDTFLKITVGVVQDLCRFHRVLIYQFDESYNGQVVSELVEWGKTTDLFKGLMFPAADIPPQARQLYTINKVRLLYDRSQSTARMVLRSKEDLDHPLDMTHCYLRAMSPIHIKYLANMHVRSSMSVSIMAFGQLWGLIACHSYGQHGMRVSFPVRQLMRILSDSISRNIERLSYARRLHTRKLISTIPTQHHPTGYIVSNADDLLQIFEADAGLLVIGDGCKLLGNNEQGTAMLAIAEYLRIMRFGMLQASSHISRDFPDLVLPRAQDTIAGLLYVPLTAKAGQDFIVFLRKGQVREVQWAGKPYKDYQANNQASLEPRKSFKMWSELVVGRSRPWTDDQLESAGVLALIYGKFIQVWREKQSAMASNQLTAILLSNTSHAVRTPLSQIINTLELALSGNIDDDTRSMLENSHQASRALLFHVHDLLDLTRIETGNETAFNDPFDIRQCIQDAVRLYQTEAARRNLEFRVDVADDLPQFVIGDSRKIRTVISNLVANSVKFTESGFIEVYCGHQQRSGGSNGGNDGGGGGQNSMDRSGMVNIEIVISDSGCGIPSDKLEAMFVTLEGAEEARAPENTGLGLGLAVVARIVEQLEGQLRAESEVNVGSRFFFTLKMVSGENSLPEMTATVNHGGSSGAGSITSLRSRSNSSLAHSEINSFVQDFASSHMFAPVAADDKRLKDAEERMSRSGTFPVTDSSYPVRPSKVDTEVQQTPSASSPTPSNEQSTSPVSRHSPSHAKGQGYSSSKKQGGIVTNAMPAPETVDDSQSTSKLQVESQTKAQTSQDRPDLSSPAGAKANAGASAKQLRVLVVEDDTINSQILQKRLRMDKHVAIAVTNGQEAVDFLRNDWAIDVILMDIQMPIMDGRTAAKEIRKLEADPEHRARSQSASSEVDGSKSLRVDGRIPIFAVSASLYESDRTDLAEAFDGWLLKPLNFDRVRALIAGLENADKRSKEVYQQGHWEKGGYLRDAKSS